MYTTEITFTFKFVLFQYYFVLINKLTRKKWGYRNVVFNDYVRFQHDNHIVHVSRDYYP